ncbi:sugar ABC transporter permease [Mycoplasmatota bacterium]|nr:sugar ABC transporter permease [Mycoplasmatota bacterium]
MNYKLEKKFWGFIFTIPWLIGFLLFFLKPFIESFYFSFHIVEPTKNGLEMTFVGLGRYINALTVHVDFLRVLLQSLLDIFINLWVILIFSLLMAVLLNTKFRGRTFARAVFFIPVIFNSAAIESALGGGEALRTLMNESGLGIMSVFDLKAYLLEADMAPWLIGFLVSSIDRIYLIISYSGVQILIFLAGLQSIPIHLYEAAKIEGATQYEIFWKITLPMVSPLILTAAVYTIVNSFLRSPITEVMQSVYNDQQYGLYAAMSWMYFGVSAILLTVVLFFLSKAVFYYDK